MNSHMEVGRIGGIPIYLDMFFVLVLVVFTYPYFTAGNSQLMATGFVIIIGLVVSILLHELGHAVAGRAFGVATREIELTGLGGVARFAGALPRSVIKRTIIYLAGPAVNLGLYYLFLQASVLVQSPFVMLAAVVLSGANLMLAILNILPAFPLDGGHTLEAWISALLGPAWATRIVACLGLAVAAGCVWYALPANFWMLFVAFFLGQVNWTALKSAGGFSGRG